MGNIRSVSKALERVAPQARVAVTADPSVIRASERVVVPGQGAMPDCMRQLAASGARDAVIEATRTKPFLGICIGMQMLFERGEEGDTPGLGLLAGDGSGNVFEANDFRYNEEGDCIDATTGAGTLGTANDWEAINWGFENSPEGLCFGGIF